MSNKKLLLPSLNTNFLDSNSGELQVKYRQGFPRNYRFDASRGLFTLNDQAITSKGEPIAFIAIGYRIFKDDILGLGLKQWAEFFFINSANHVCSLLFHGFSVENLERKTVDLFYDEVNLTEVILTATPIEKTKKSGEGKGSKYYIADFSYQTLPQEARNEIKLLGEALQVYRNDTLTENALVELFVNYQPPSQLIEQETHPNSNSSDKGSAPKSDKKI